MGAIAILICVVPFIMLNRRKKKREKLFLQSLSKIAAPVDGQIDQYEIIGNFAIGMDEAKNMVFFYRPTKDKVEAQFVELEGFQKSKVIKTYRSFKNNNGIQKEIDRLELCFIPTLKDTPQIKLEFYNSDVSMRLNGELQSIEKWSNLINDQLKHIK